MKLEIDIAEHHYNNIMALDSVSLGRVPYKGIIMYSINAIKHGKVLEQEPTIKNEAKYCDRNICLKNEFNNVGYEDCEVTKSQEPTAKNCESCRYYGSHHEVCNYCYKCSLWTEKEPTTKNDLAQERYQDLKEYFGDNETAKTILEDKKEFKAWLERVKWHVKRADELARELEHLKLCGHCTYWQDTHEAALPTTEYDHCSHYREVEE